MLARTTMLVIIALLLLMTTGCSTSTQIDNPFDRDSDTPARRAAFAASSQYPSTQPSANLAATALINRSNNSIQIVNASDRALSDVKVWVNGAFVTRVGSIPSHGSVTLDRARFFDRNGKTLADTQTAATRVDLETADNFFRLQGPVFE